MHTIIEQLDRFSACQAQRNALNMEKQATIDRVFTPDIRARCAEIDAEFSTKAQTVVEQIAALEADIKNSVLAHGETVKGSRHTAVWSKGRVSWNDEGLKGYMKAHPEITDFRTQGEPSISIRTNSNGTM